MKKLLTLALLTTLVSACSPTVSPIAFQTQPAQLQAQGLGDLPNRAQEPDPGLTTRMLRSLYKNNFADDVSNNRPDETVPQPRGGFVYGSLTKMSWVRKAIYLLSDKVIKYEFNKPGQEDNLARISTNEVQQLLKILKPGDIVLCGNNNSFVHGLVYLGNDQIIHALAQLKPNGDYLGVIKETLTGYTKRVARDRFVVLRKPGLTPQDFKRMSDYAHSTLGTSYDSLFLLNTKDRLYCTEILFHTLNQMGPGRAPRVMPHKAKYGWDLFTVEDIMDSPDLQTVWEYNHKRPTPGRLHRY